MAKISENGVNMAAGEAGEKLKIGGCGVGGGCQWLAKESMKSESINESGNGVSINENINTM
jgi:hypothetical protein